MEKVFVGFDAEPIEPVEVKDLGNEFNAHDGLGADPSAVKEAE